MKRSGTVTIAAILVVLLLLVSAVWPLVGGDELLGLGNSGQPGRNMPSGPQGNPPDGTPPGFNGTVKPPSQPEGTPQPGMDGAPDGQQVQPGMTGGMQPNIGEVPTGNGMMPIMRILQYVLYALVIGCGLIAFGGLWTWKRWGIVMAVVTSVIVIVMSVVSLFGMISTVVLVESIIRIVISLAVTVLVLLPKSKVMETAIE